MIDSKFKIWLLATRPKTLPASLGPVLLGTSYAYSKGFFEFLPFIIILICAVLIQIIANFFNEYYDYVRGADEVRVGPRRAVSSGLIKPKEMFYATFSLVVITFLFGLYLYSITDITILVIGMFCLAFAWAYTGGSYPLAYIGAADFFAFLCFGPIATFGVNYIQTKGTFDIMSIIIGLSPGFLIANLLAINNIRDRENDYKVGKMTLAVRIGEKHSKLLFTSIMFLTYINVLFIADSTKNIMNLMPLISLPIAIRLTKNIYFLKGEKLNKALAQCGALILIFCLLASLGFVLSKSFNFYV